MIVAGAGTGKTKVLTSRIVWLILTGRAKPEEILALTFTEKATGEMMERLDIALPLGMNQVEIGTFHSVCDRFLRRHALEMGLDTDFKVITDAEALLLLRSALFELPLKLYRPRHSPVSYLRALLTHFGKAKDEVLSPEDYLAWVEELERELKDREESDPALWDRCHRQGELAGCYQAYQNLLTQRGYLDFGDLLLRFLDLLRECPQVKSLLQKRFKYILVDEFQDTNHAQFELIRQLANSSQSVTVVGDDDQAIYGFRGAALSNILNFGECFPGATEVVLNENFRSSQVILDAAYRGIKNNDPYRLEVKSGLNKQLIAAGENAGPSGPESIELNMFQTLTEEADAVAEHLESLVASAGFDFSDCAILTRTNKDARSYLQALNLRDIPFRFTGSHGLYDTEEVRLLLSFARTMVDPFDSLSCFHLASSPLFSLPRLELIALNAYARRNNLSLRQAMSEHREGTPEDGLELQPEEFVKLDSFLSFLESFTDRVMEDTPGQVLQAFLAESGWLAILGRAQDMTAVIQAQNLAKFFDQVKSYELLFPEGKLPQYVEHFDLLKESGASPAVVESDHDSSAVSILTIHSSKGLEFRAVFLVGLTSQRFPSWQRPDPLEFPSELKAHSAQEFESERDANEKHVSEERRLFYVAVTRAKERLWLSMAYDEGRRRSSQVSPFVREILSDRALDLRPQRCSAVEQLSQVSSETTPRTEAGWGVMPDEQALRLSFRKLNLYWNCPRQYLYSEVMQLATPTPHSVTYGQALHEAVKFVLTLKQEGSTPTLEEVQARFRSRWRREGFLSAEHLQSDLERGLKSLETFLSSEIERPSPHFVEREFRFRLENNWVVGRWDRVDRDERGWVVTDYKSTEVRTQEDADRRAGESRQLVLYSLALEQMFGELPQEVRLSFLGSGLVGASKVNSRDLYQLKNDIRRAAQGMRKRDYQAKPSWKQCGQCAFKTYCPETATKGL